MLGKEISTEGPIHILNCSESLAVLAKFNYSSPLRNPFNTYRLLVGYGNICTSSGAE